jgi:TolB-like protein
MKRCPTCNRAETDETLKFCRDDGTLLISDASVSNDSSATRILPGSQTGEPRAVPTETAQPQGTTSALDAGKDSKARTGELKEGRATLSAEHFLSGIKRHKIAALILLIVIAAGIAGTSFYLRARNSEVTIGSIAVLPFVNQNNDPNTEYLSDGIPESIISSLSQLPNLKVMSRNSVFHYKGKDIDAPAVAKELKVQAVLTGRMTQRGDGLSINVELINAQDNSQIWGQQYNRKLADVFAVQEEIAREISEKLRLRLTGAERQQLAKRPTENLRAFQYYMQGRAYNQRSTREDQLIAIRYCEKAIEEDRNYALAYTGLSDAYLVLGARGHVAPIEGRHKAEDAARQALSLDNNLAEAHAALGASYALFSPANFSLADRELRRAIELSPSLALAHHYLGISLVRQGRLDEGSVEFFKARELDPLSPIIARNVALPYCLKRDYVRALELLRQANELGPALATTWEIGVYIQNRLFDEALAELEKAKRERKDAPILLYSTGRVYAAQGKRAEAHQIITELEAMSGANLDEAHWIAKIYAALNEKELAFSWLERGLATGAIGVFYKDEPVWDPIRSDPRFEALVEKMFTPIKMPGDAR